MDIWNEKRRQLLLVGTVKDEMLVNFCTTLQDKVEPGEPFEILLNSGGGMNTALTTLMSLIESYKARGSVVRIIGAGTVASAAVPLLVSGCKGERYIFGSNTLLMLHETQVPFEEKKVLSLHELQELTVRTQMLMDQYVGYLTKNCGKTAEAWREIIPTHQGKLELTADEAVKLGLADRVMETLPEALKLVGGDTGLSQAA